MPKRTVLIADDDTLFCWALQKELTSRGLDAFIANTGRECLEAFSRKRFDLLFLDIHFPDANGLDLLKAIRKDSPGTRVAVVSGDGCAGNKEAALAAGAEQFLEKPFDIDMITRFVSDAFRDKPCLRKHSRYLCNFPLRLSVIAPAPEEAQFHLGGMSVTAVDVGMEGIRLTTEYPLRNGQGVLLRFDGEADPFSNMVPGEAFAEVVWASSSGTRSTAGLRFLPGNPFTA